MGPKSTHYHIISEYQEAPHNFGRNEKSYPVEDFFEAVYMAVRGTKQFRKACGKWKRKPAHEQATEAQARTFFKDVYEIFDAERDSFHEIGAANNAVMQGKFDEATA